KNTKAYKEYYAFATGEAAPKPKASARRKRSDEGTGLKPGVLDVPTDESEEELSWNSSDDEGADDQEKVSDDDESDEGNDSEEGEEDDDDDEDKKGDERDDDNQDQEIAKHDDKDDTKESGDVDEEGGSDKEEDNEETRDEESFDPIPQTPESSKDESDGEEDQEEKLDRKNEMKARGTLLIALSNKDQLKFHSYQNTKLLIEAIEKRLQKLISQLEIQGSSSTSQNPQNVAFVSFNSTNSTSITNEADNTAFEVSTAHTQGNTINSTSVDNLSDAVICAFIASQPNSPQLAREDLEQIDPDDLDEMDLY
nr:hypothetical protein [Tanacetum cinerariifolium]